MAAQCPNCGSRYLRESRRRDPAIKPSPWKFESSLRCLDCKTRFVGRTFHFEDLFFAHCPSCDRMDLNSWTGKNYVPPIWAGVKIKLGGHRWRCEYCRINFSSFRRRKEIFTFKRWEKLNSQSAVAEGRARVAGLEAKLVQQREREERHALEGILSKLAAESEAAPKAD